MSDGECIHVGIGIIVENHEQFIIDELVIVFESVHGEYQAASDIFRKSVVVIAKRRHQAVQSGGIFVIFFLCQVKQACCDFRADVLIRFVCPNGNFENGLLEIGIVALKMKKKFLCVVF